MQKKRSILAAFLVIFNLLLQLCPLTFFSKAAATDPFTVNSRLFVDGSNIAIFGEVINNKTVPVCNVSVRITFLDNNQIALKNYSTTAWLSVILPNRRAPFNVFIESQEVEGYAEYKVEIEHYDVGESKPTGLLIPVASLALVENATYVKGEIMNDNTDGIGIDRIIVIACFYDSTGFLAAASDILELSTPLFPSLREEFLIGTKYVNYTVTLQKYILTAETPSLENHPGYIINDEVILLIKPKQGDQGFNPRLIILILAVIAIIATVIIASRTRKSKAKTRWIKPYSKKR